MYKYKNPPLLEVSCELIFAENSNYNPQSIETFGKLILPDFPILRVSNRIGVIFDTDSKSLKPAQDTFNEYFSTDEKDLVRLEKGKLSIHQLKPYKKWEHFSELLSQSLPRYTEAFGSSDLARIGLRYVNEMQFEDADFLPSKYFNGMPDFQDGFWGESYNGFQCISQKIFRLPVETQIRVSLTEGPRDNVDGLKHRVILDLDIFSLHQKSADIGAILDWLKSSKERCNAVFENLLSDEAKEIFKG